MDTDKKGKEVENRHFEKLKLKLKTSYFANKFDRLKSLETTNFMKSFFLLHKSQGFFDFGVIEL